MDIQRKKRPTQGQPSRSKDLSFLKRDFADRSAAPDGGQGAARITKPQTRSQVLKPWTNLKARRIMLIVVAGLIIVSLGYLAGQQLGNTEAGNTERHGKGTLKDTEADNVETLKPESDLFDAQSFYKIELIDGREFYARVEATSLDHYKLTQIFYQEGSAEERGRETLNDAEEVNVEGSDISEDQLVSVESDNRIILIKYGTEAERTVDELILPREQVTLLTPLSETSPILEAIEAYLK